MRARLLAVVAASGIVLLPAPPAAQASRDPLATGVRLDGTSPTAGEAVHGVRLVSGVAQAPEGVTAVALYVVPTGRVPDLAADRPAATTTPALVPVLGPVGFGFDWDSRSAGASTVDLHVVAWTALRVLGTEVRGVRVRPEPASPAGPGRAVGAARARTGTSGAAGLGADAAAARSGSDGVYLGDFDSALPYQPTFEAAPGTRSAVTPVAAARSSGAPRDGWLSVALGLTLVVVAAHVHRLLRRHPAPTDPRGST